MRESRVALLQGVESLDVRFDRWGAQRESRQVYLPTRDETATCRDNHDKTQDTAIQLETLADGRRHPADDLQGRPLLHCDSGHAAIIGTWGPWGREYLPSQDSPSHE